LLLSDAGSDTWISFRSNGLAQTTVISGLASPSSLTSSDFIFNTSTASDSLSGTANADDLFGGLGNDDISGNAGADRLFGEDGNDALFGGGHDDELYGGAGNDTLQGDGGNDSISGGTGTGDTVVFTGNWLDYAISSDGGSVFTLTDTRGGSPDGTDTVDGAEFFSFANGTFAADQILNNAPIGVDDTNASDAVIEAGGAGNAVVGDSSAIGNVLTNDTDPDSALGDTKVVNAARAGTEVAGGTLSSVAGATQLSGIFGTLTISQDGSYSYALNDADSDTEALAQGSTGTDVFTYQVTDGFGLSDTAQLSITVTGANDAPVITFGGGGASAAVSVAENGTSVAAVTATDVDAGTALTYSLIGGADVAKFTINATTGALSFITAPDFETRTDSGANGIYDVTVQVSDGSLSDSQTIAVTVTDANDAPVITSGGGSATLSVSIAENSTAVTTVVATDADAGATLSYSIAGGADAAKFTIDATTGALSFISAPDFETKADVGANNQYDVTVQVSDGNLTDTQDLAVKVTNVNEAPEISSNGGGASADISVAENTALVTTVVAVDFDANSVLTYSLAGGADSTKFIINSVTGELSFRFAPNFEFPIDAGGNNVFNVGVRVSDGTFTDVQALAVTLTDGPDAPFIQSNGGGSSAVISVAENGTAVTTVVGIDEDAGTNLTYSIIGGADASKFTVDAETGELNFISAPDFETKADAGGNNVYDVTIQVSDGGLVDSQAIAVTVTNINEKPTITSGGGGASTAVSMNENHVAVSTITASDVDAGSTLTFSVIGGADAALFKVDASTGALSFISAPDFETPLDAGGNNIYDVVVQVSDGILTNTQELAVTVNDVPGTTIIGTSGDDKIDLKHKLTGQPLPTKEGDVLKGSAGNDTLDGGLGGDTMLGGTGDDTYLVNETSDIVKEKAGQGIDLVKASVDFSLSGNLENLRLMGNSGLSGSGNSRANVLTGTSGNDTLTGNGGDDTLDGGAGTDRMTGGNDNDTYLVDDANDRTIETRGGGIDTVISTVSYAIGSGIEVLTLSGSGAINGTGNNLANTMTGNAKANFLFGNRGNDNLMGLAGNDTIQGGKNADSITGGAGTDVMTGGSGHDVFIFTSLSDSKSSATNRDVITDFSKGDHIDLAAIDANHLVEGFQHFVLDSDGSFSAGEIELKVVGADMVVRLNVDGDAAAEFTLLVQNVGSLSAEDFIL
ncbi:MAG: cadherin domain-containing protein, partial [bacterium]